MIEIVEILLGGGGIAAGIKFLLMLRKDAIEQLTKLTEAVSSLSAKMEAQNLRLSLLLESAQRDLAHLTKRVDRLEDSPSASKTESPE